MARIEPWSSKTLNNSSTIPTDSVFVIFMHTLIYIRRETRDKNKNACGGIQILVIQGTYQVLSHSNKLCFHHFNAHFDIYIHLKF